VGLLATTHPKLDRSGGDHQPALALGDAAVAVASVAVQDVDGEGVGESVPVELVGVVVDELGARSKMRLDPVQVAGVGGQRHELDVALSGELASGVQLADRLSWIQYSLIACG